MTVNNYHDTYCALSAVREDRTPGGKHKNANLLKVKLPSSDEIPQRMQLTHWSSPLITKFKSISNSMIPPLKKDDRIITDVKAQNIDYVLQLADWQIEQVWGWFDKLDFLAKIDYEDRKVLVQNSLMEILAFGLARRSMGVGNILLLGEGVLLDIETANIAGIGEIAQRVLQLSSKLSELKLVEEEYVCLTIIVLLNPGECYVVHCAGWLCSCSELYGRYVHSWVKLVLNVNPATVLF